MLPVCAELDITSSFPPSCVLLEKKCQSVQGPERNRACEKGQADWNGTRNYLRLRLFQQ